MHKIYEEKGAFNFVYNLPQIIYSSIISGVINALIKILALTSSNIIKLKNGGSETNVNKVKEEILFMIKIKSVFFFIFSFIFLLAFWIYLACFCYVYKNTQIHLITDTCYSLCTSMIIPFFTSILPGIFRLSALNAKKKDKECIYKLSKAFQLL